MQSQTKMLMNRQHDMWRLREQYGWSLERIARRFDLSPGTVSRLLAQTADRKEIPKLPRPAIRRLRKVRPVSLSRFHTV